MKGKLDLLEIFHPRKILKSDPRRTLLVYPYALAVTMAMLAGMYFLGGPLEVVLGCGSLWAVMVVQFYLLKRELKATPESPRAQSTEAACSSLPPSEVLPSRESEVEPMSDNHER